jgi:hypothetical protein
LAHFNGVDGASQSIHDVHDEFLAHEAGN